MQREGERERRIYAHTHVYIYIFIYLYYSNSNNYYELYVRRVETEQHFGKLHSSGNLP